MTTTPTPTSTSGTCVTLNTQSHPSKMFTTKASCQPVGVSQTPLWWSLPLRTWEQLWLTSKLGNKSSKCPPTKPLRRSSGPSQPRARWLQWTQKETLQFFPSYPKACIQIQTLNMQYLKYLPQPGQHMLQSGFNQSAEWGSASEINSSALILRATKLQFIKQNRFPKLPKRLSNSTLPLKEWTSV